MREARKVFSRCRIRSTGQGLGPAALACVSPWPARWGYSDLRLQKLLAQVREALH